MVRTHRRRARAREEGGRLKPPTREEINELWNAGGLSLDQITETAEALADSPFISNISNVLTAAMLVLMGILIAEKRAAQKETLQ